MGGLADFDDGQPLGRGSVLQLRLELVLRVIAHREGVEVLHLDERGVLSAFLFDQGRGTTVVVGVLYQTRGGSGMTALVGETPLLLLGSRYHAGLLLGQLIRLILLRGS